jgi:hypothetical protein
LGAHGSDVLARPSSVRTEEQPAGLERWLQQHRLLQCSMSLDSFRHDHQWSPSLPIDIASNQWRECTLFWSTVSQPLLNILRLIAGEHRGEVLGWTRVSTDADLSFVLNGTERGFSIDKDRDGWFVGAGIETKLGC